MHEKHNPGADFVLTDCATRTATELVAELEFVWNQIKDNHSPSSSGSFRKDTSYGMPPSPRQDEYYDTRDFQDRERDRERDRNRNRDRDLDHDHERQHRRPSLGATASDGGPMKILSPMSEEDEAERENRIRMIEEELEAAVSADDDDLEEEEERDEGNGDDDEGGATRRRRGITTVHNGSRGGSRGSATAAAAAAVTAAGAGDPAKRGSQRWSKMMERAMVKLSAEVAALREQITSGREFRSRREKSSVAWFGWLAWVLFKHITLDLFILALVLLWMRRRKDRRLEDHVRGSLRVLREYIRVILPSR